MKSRGPVAGRDVRVVAEDGSLRRELALDPARDYKPLGPPAGLIWPHNVRQLATNTGDIILVLQPGIAAAVQVRQR